MQSLTAGYGTDQKCALPQQPQQVSEGKLTCQRGFWEVAATAACDPNRPWTRRAHCNAAIVSPQYARTNILVSLGLLATADEVIG